MTPKLSFFLLSNMCTFCWNNYLKMEDLLKVELVHCWNYIVQIHAHCLRTCIPPSARPCITPPPPPVFRVWLFDTSADRYSDVLHHIVSLFSATFLIDLAPHININQVALTIVFQKPLQQSTSSKLDFCLSELSYLGVNRYIRFPQLHSSDCEYFIGFIVIDVKVHYIVLIPLLFSFKLPHKNFLCR